MNRIILHLIVAGFCLTFGHALKCYNCHIGFKDVCLTTKITCDSGELCFKGEGKAAGVVSIIMKGCLKEAECNKTTEMNFPSDSNTTIYSMTKTCCNTDLCNAAPGHPGVSGLPLALAAVAAVFLAHVCV
ncbi:sperm acrosome membrane-associated protein 4 [Thalassophryne amazonica]|uniref:sperm acrosome membrane-associated protein 4 n=1 Tax=Thalassophryne amazonica TaxID=390379 RepID=UPI0014726345|nr:sperm acrosome membrane-associated protein 4 [Thalassophryne amazonica]